MYTTPFYVWLITIAGVIAVPGLTRAQLYRGVRRARLGRLRVAALTGRSRTRLGTAP